MHVRAIAPLAAAVALCLSSVTAVAAEIEPAELLKQAKAEQPAYLETVEQLVAVDTGTGQEKGLPRSARCWSSACRHWEPR